MVAKRDGNSSVDNAPSAKKAPTKKVGKKKAGKKKAGRKKAPTKKAAKKKPRSYPRASLEKALAVPFVLKEKNGGNPWPPGDVAAAIGISPKTNDFFYMAAASRDFGLTDGGRDSKEISLTDFGRELVYAPSKQEEQAKRREALLNVEIFRRVLDYYKGSKLPEMKYLGNTLDREFGLDPDYHQEFSQLFKENCDYLEIGAGFDAPTSRAGASGAPAQATHIGTLATVVLAEPVQQTGLRCFVAMPFVPREPDRPKGFFDEVLRSLISPAGREAGFEVVTANREGTEVIQATIINELLDADLVIADLTENNPNVLFELGLRIAHDKPIALIRGKGTRSIFDVDNMLRVLEYDQNLWQSTVEHDLPKLTDHIRASWNGRDNPLTYMKILRGNNS